MTEQAHLILVINPGSTSTKLALYDDSERIAHELVRHSAEELSPFDRIWDQLDFRLRFVDRFTRDVLPDSVILDAVAARGGLLRPVEGGVYEVNHPMLRDAEDGYQGEHASNLGCALAHHIAEKYNTRAFVVDPVSTNEMSEIARISGTPDIERRSLSHALSLHYVSRSTASEMGVPYDRSRFVIAHLGGGISIAPVQGGRIIDVNDANNEGPFSTSRSGTLPPLTLAEWILNREVDYPTVRRKLLKQSGWSGYLGTADGKEVERRIQNGDTNAEFILKAMAYQVAKEIAAMSSVLSGRVDAIVLTGGLAAYGRLVQLVEDRVDWIAPVRYFTGEMEMDALAEGVLRVLCDEEESKVYK